MSFTTTLTSKNQLTLPKPVRERLGLRKGTKIDIFPTLDGGFIGRPKRESNIGKISILVPFLKPSLSLTGLGNVNKRNQD